MPSKDQRQGPPGDESMIGRRVLAVLFGIGSVVVLATWPAATASVVETYGDWRRGGWGEVVVGWAVLGVLLGGGALVLWSRSVPRTVAIRVVGGGAFVVFCLVAKVFT